MCCNRRVLVHLFDVRATNYWVFNYFKLRHARYIESVLDNMIEGMLA